MPAHAPDWVTDEGQRELYRALSREYEDYLGPDESLWEERERKFLDVLTMIQTKLDRFPCMNCGGKCENISHEVGGVNWKCPNCGWEPVTVTEMVVDPTAGIYASQSVTDELAHVVAVLKEHELCAMLPEPLAEITESAISSGSALVEILRSQ